MMMIFFEKNFFLHKSRLLVVRERGRIARAGSSSKKCPGLKHFLSHSMLFYSFDFKRRVSIRNIWSNYFKSGGIPAGQRTRNRSDVTLQHGLACREIFIETLFFSTTPSAILIYLLLFFRCCYLFTSWKFRMMMQLLKWPFLFKTLQQVIHV